MSVFQENYRSLARALAGRKLSVGNVEAEIVQAEGYSRRQNDAPLYRPILEMKPGHVYCPRHRGGLLVLIACADGDGPGGCILLRKVKVGQTVYDGPGRVAEALGITEPKATGRITKPRGNLLLTLD